MMHYNEHKSPKTYRRSCGVPRVRGRTGTRGLLCVLFIISRHTHTLTHTLTHSHKETEIKRFRGKWLCGFRFTRIEWGPDFPVIHCGTMVPWVPIVQCVCLLLAIREYDVSPVGQIHPLKPPYSQTLRIAC